MAASPASTGDPDTPAYRADGWPLCPQCGEDELWSRAIPARPTDELTCYLCGWHGWIAPRAYAEYIAAWGEVYEGILRPRLTRH
jgi:predicted RNA-binding Zn-ribbon protein involved in translation (DUF1610 family)